MEHLEKAAAMRRHSEWSDGILARPGQHVYHVLTPETGPNGFFIGDPAYERFIAGGRGAAAEARSLLAASAINWPYTRTAIGWKEINNGNTRVVIHPEKDLRTLHSWRRYAVQIMWPVLAQLCGEEILLLTREQCLQAGMPIYPFDVNVWGSRGTIRTGYRVNTEPGLNDDDDWREFADWSTDPARAQDDCNYVAQVVAFARLEGRLIRPARLRLSVAV